MTTPLFDSHAHLDFAPLAEDLDGVLTRAAAAGVTRIVAIGTGREPSALGRALAIARDRPNVMATVGVHPHDADHASEALLQALGDLAREASVVAVGETGLDYHYRLSTPEHQRSAFRSQLRLAARLNKPVVLHLREAHAEALAILREEGLPERGGIVHCFSGGPDQVAEYLDLGLHVSFSGIVTFPRAEPVRAAATRVPLDRLLVETDAPYLAPVPFRGRPNEPAWVWHTVSALAALRSEPCDAIGRATAANAARLFGVDCDPAPGR
jgi:TatD DNase family protein